MTDAAFPQPSPQDILRASENPSVATVCMMLGELKAGMSLLLEADRQQDIKISAIEARLVGLEKWQARLLGAWAVITAFGAACGGFIVNHIWR